ncbi:hypothetical protein, partial [Escherichia coli]|uniref:hypothetical protein n=1 Tax=Escherichia coli TaxID=562 RepID=UPI003FA0C33A
WNDSSGNSVSTQSIHQQSESSVSRLYTFTPVKLLIAWQFGAKYYVLTNKWRGSSPSLTRL